VQYTITRDVTQKPATRQWSFPNFVVSNILQVRLSCLFPICFRYEFVGLELRWTHVRYLGLTKRMLPSCKSLWQKTTGEWTLRTISLFRTHLSIFTLEFHYGFDRLFFKHIWYMENCDIHWIQKPLCVDILILILSRYTLRDINFPSDPLLGFSVHCPDLRWQWVLSIC